MKYWGSTQLKKVGNPLRIPHTGTAVCKQSMPQSHPYRPKNTKSYALKNYYHCISETVRRRWEINWKIPPFNNSPHREGLCDWPTWQNSQGHPRSNIKKCREPSRDAPGCSPRPTWRVYVTENYHGHPRSNLRNCTKSVHRGLKCSDMTPLGAYVTFWGQGHARSSKVKVPKMS